MIRIFSLAALLFIISCTQQDSNTQISPQNPKFHKKPIKTKLLEAFHAIKTDTGYVKDTLFNSYKIGFNKKGEQIWSLSSNSDTDTLFHRDYFFTEINGDTTTYYKKQDGSFSRMEITKGDTTSIFTYMDRRYQINYYIVKNADSLLYEIDFLSSVKTTPVQQKFNSNKDVVWAVYREEYNPMKYPNPWLYNKDYHPSVKYTIHQFTYTYW